MKDRKSKSLILAFSIVALIFLSSVGSFGTSIDTFNDGDSVEVTGIKIKSSTVALKLNSQSIKTSSIKIKSNNFNTMDIESYNNSDNIVVVNTSADESYPSMVVAGRNALVAYEHDDKEIIPSNWLFYDNGISDKGVPIQNLTWTIIAIRLTPTELSGYDGFEITTIRFWHNTTTHMSHTGYVEVYGTGTVSNPGALITSEYFNVNGEGWKDVILSSPVTIDYSEEYWIGVNFTMAGNDIDYPAELDTQPAVDGKGGWINNGSGWFELQNFGAPYDHNLMLRTGIVEPVTEPYIYLRKSGNYGQSWPDELNLTFKIDSKVMLVTTPSLCITPMKEHAYGTFTSPMNNSGIIGYFDIPDISKFDGITYFAWDLSEYYENGVYICDFWNFSHPDIIHNHIDKAPWISIYTGSTNYTDKYGVGAANDTLMYFFINDIDPRYVVLSWNHEIENCSNLSLAMDNASKNFYGICEKMNGTNQDLLFFSGFYDHNETGDPFMNLSYQIFTGPEDLRHPKIFIKDEDIYIVAEIADGGTKDIIIYHSSDGGENWDTIDPTGSSVPPPDFAPKYPLISANETDILCTYIEDNNLSLTISNNSGVNWSDTVQLNNVNSSVVEEFRFADMPDTKHIIWTDNRERNYDLYSVSHAPLLNLMIVPGSLNITATDMRFFSTNNWVIFKVNNTGEDYAEDVKIEVIVNRTGNEPYITKYPGFIKYLASGAEKSFKEPIFRITLKGYIKAVYDLEGIDFITVEIIPSETFPDSDPSDNSESIPVSYEDIFPKLSQRPILLTIIKLLARIMPG